MLLLFFRLRTGTGCVVWRCRSTGKRSPSNHATIRSICWVFVIVWRRNVPISSHSSTANMQGNLVFYAQVRELSRFFSYFGFKFYPCECDSSSWQTFSVSFSASTSHTYAEALSSMYSSESAEAPEERVCYRRCTDQENEQELCFETVNSSSSSSSSSDQQQKTMLHSPSSIFAASSSLSDSSSHNASSSSSSSSSLHTGGAVILSIARAPWTTLGFVARLLAFWIIRTLSRRHDDVDLGLT